VGHMNDEMRGEIGDELGVELPFLSSETGPKFGKFGDVL
jgi:hypothetical protein